MHPSCVKCEGYSPRHLPAQADGGLGVYSESASPNEASSPVRMSRTGRNKGQLLRLGLLVVAFLTALFFRANGEELPRQIHPWGRFEPGAWKIVRATTENFEGGQNSISVTETRATLQEVADWGVTIQVEVMVEVAGKRFRAEPQLVKQGFHGDLFAEDTKVTRLGKQDLKVQDQAVPCELVQVDSAGPNYRVSTKLAFSRTVQPYVFHRESVRSDLTGAKLMEKSQTEVTVLDMPIRIGSQVLAGSQTRTIQTSPRGKVVTLTLTSVDVPGGVVCQTSRESDENDRLLRRTTLELIDYGLRPSVRYSGRLRWHFQSRRTYRLPDEWIRPGLLPETLGVSWPGPDGDQEPDAER